MIWQGLFGNQRAEIITSQNSKRPVLKAIRRRPANIGIDPTLCAMIPQALIRRHGNSLLFRPRIVGQPRSVDWADEGCHLTTSGEFRNLIL